MATFDDVYSARNKAYDDIWNIAQDALSTLSVAANNTASPAPFDNTTLKFDPSAPKPIDMLDTPNVAGILNNIDNYINKLSLITAPQFPDMPSFQMYDHQVWNDSFAEQIKSGLSNYMTTMGIPDVTYQNAIFNEDYDRNLHTLNDLFDLADAKTGARGFNYTNDYGNSLKIDAQVKYQYDRTQVSRNISKLVTEWARENYAMAIKEGIALETFHADFTYKYCTAFVSIYKDVVMALLQRFKAQVELVTAPIDALVKELSAVMEPAKLQFEVDKTNETLKQSRAEIQIKEALAKYDADAKTIVNEFQNQMQNIRDAANHASGLAQATTASVIGFTKK